MAWPIYKNKPIHRQYFLEFNNMWSEVRLKEIKFILGWDLYIIRLTVRLPDDKYKDWSRDITNMLGK